jgi:hypothetical protein
MNCGIPLLCRRVLCRPDDPSARGVSEEAVRPFLLRDLRVLEMTQLLCMDRRFNLVFEDKVVAVFIGPFELSRTREPAAGIYRLSRLRKRS